MNELGAEVGPPLLAGLRVVEHGPRIAAPLVGLLLAEQGAEVVRVVDRRQRSEEPVLDAILARGKIEAEIDGRDPSDRRRVLDAVSRADVVVLGDEPTGPTSLARAIDAAGPELHPGLIRCRVRAFPSYDPRSRLPGHEAVAGAVGYLYTKPLGPPELHGFPVGSVTAALYAACGVVAALIARLGDGRGQQVDTSLLHGNLLSQQLQIFMKAGVPRGFLPLKMVGSPAMRCWRCRDDRYVYLHITMPAHNRRILELLAQAGLTKEVARLRAVMSEQTLRDPSQVGSIAEAKQIKAIYESIFVQRTADEWERLLGLELCCIKVRTAPEWLEDSLAAGMSDAALLDDPRFGPLLAPGVLVTTDQTPSELRPRQVDAQQVDRTWTRWQAMPSPLAGPPADPSAPVTGPPLAGVRVADLSRIIAGPCAARVLAELGAEVLSIQSPTGLDWALSFHLLFNAGKRSVTLDFTSDEGKARLWRLLSDFRPDVLLHNYRHVDVARRAGVGPEAVRERLPGAVYAHLNAYGNHGIWKDRPGFEQVVQAVSGIQMSYARRGRPRLLPSPIIDIGCGLLGAFGALLGLFGRRRTGQTTRVSTHLTSIAVLLQLPAIASEQRERGMAHARARGHECQADSDREVVVALLRSFGISALLAGPRGDLRRWMELEGLDAGRGPTKGRELEIAASHFTPASLLRWPSSFVRAGVGATVALVAYPRIARVLSTIRRSDPRDPPFLFKRAYPGTPEPLAFTRCPIELGRSPLPLIDPPPLRGGNSAEVLARVGDSLPVDAGVLPYPPNKPLPVWLASFVRWGYFAWKSGNI